MNHYSFVIFIFIFSFGRRKFYYQKTTLIDAQITKFTNTVDLRKREEMTYLITVYLLNHENLNYMLSFCARPQRNVLKKCTARAASFSWLSINSVALVWDLCHFKFSSITGFKRKKKGKSSFRFHLFSVIQHIKEIINMLENLKISFKKYTIRKKLKHQVSYQDQRKNHFQRTRNSLCRLNRGGSHRS